MWIRYIFGPWKMQKNVLPGFARAQNKQKGTVPFAFSGRVDLPSKASEEDRLSGPARLRTTLSCPPTAGLQIHYRARQTKTASLKADRFRFGQSGFEPPTPWSRTRCASPCATTRKSLVYYMVFGFHCQQEEWAQEHQSFIDIILHIMIFL